MKNIVYILCGLIALMIIGGCSSTSPTTYSEQSFIGTWTGTDSATNASVSVVIALANAAAPNGPTTAITTITIPAQGNVGPFAATAVNVPRVQPDSTEYFYYAGPNVGQPSTAIPAGVANYNFTLYISPSSTTGAMNFQFTVVGPSGNFIGPSSIALTKS